MCIFFLCFAILTNLKHADPACASGAECNMFSQVLRDIADRTGLWEQEGMRGLFLIMNTSPYNLEASLRLKLNDADVQQLVQDDRR